VKDLLVGEAYGYIFYYRNVGTNASPVFAGYDTLKMQNGQPIDAYFGARFGMVDWYGDGDYDIIVSGYDGYIEMYENTADIGINEYDQTIVAHSLIITPNPVSNNATMHFAIAQPAHVTASLYGIDGRHVSTVVDNYHTTGNHSVSWSNDLPAGVYIVHLVAGTDTQATRMVVVQ
jgi:hypothetical protein